MFLKIIIAIESTDVGKHGKWTKMRCPLITDSVIPTVVALNPLWDAHSLAKVSKLLVLQRQEHVDKACSALR